MNDVRTLLEGVKAGTVFCALVNGWTIGQCSRWLGNHFDFVDALDLRKRLE